MPSILGDLRRGGSRVGHIAVSQKWMFVCILIQLYVLTLLLDLTTPINNIHIFMHQTFYNEMETKCTLFSGGDKQARTPALPGKDAHRWGDLRECVVEAVGSSELDPRITTGQRCSRGLRLETRASPSEPLEALL